MSVTAVGRRVLEEKEIRDCVVMAGKRQRPASEALALRFLEGYGVRIGQLRTVFLE